MSDRLREILANGLVSANYKQGGENFVRVDFKCPNEANDFFRALMLITAPTLRDELENDLGEVYKPTDAEKNRRVLDLFNDQSMEIIDGIPGYAIRFSHVFGAYEWGNCDGERGNWFRNKPDCIENARKHSDDKTAIKPEWRPMETAPTDGTVIEILFQLKPFEDAIHLCRYTDVGITGGQYHQFDNYAKGWRPIDEQ